MNESCGHSKDVAAKKELWFLTWLIKKIALNLAKWKKRMYGAACSVI